MITIAIIKTMCLSTAFSSYLVALYLKSMENVSAFLLYFLTFAAFSLKTLSS